ncbi:MAG: hypothetical protein R2724_21325 [Bryobacterales bacterium]
MSFRFSQMDFKAKDRDGLGENWPLNYDEISPYYDKAEEFIGVTGTIEGSRPRRTASSRSLRLEGPRIAGARGGQEAWDSVYRESPRRHHVQ